MTTQDLMKGLAELSVIIPGAGPAVRAILLEIAAGDDRKLELLEQALDAMPSESEIDAARARIYAEEMAKKILNKSLGVGGGNNGDGK